MYLFRFRCLFFSAEKFHEQNIFHILIIFTHTLRNTSLEFGKVRWTRFGNFRKCSTRFYLMRAVQYKVLKALNRIEHPAASITRPCG